MRPKAKPSASGQRAGTVNSVVRGLHILSSLDQGSLGVVDIAEKLALNKATVYRLLKTLESGGFVTQDPLTRKYYLGAEIIKLSAHPIASNEKLVLCAQQDMLNLCKTSSETVILEILYGLQRMNLEAIESDEPIRFRASKGNLAPLYVGAGGKVLLSQFKTDILPKYLENIELTPLGPNALLDKDRLLSEIALIRKRGYATSFSERHSYGSSLSVPIVGYSCPAALSIVGPVDRWKPRMLEYVQPLLAASKNISRKLMGY
jgi:IclR family transcriptional regulator, KDG regulon repressor